MSLSHSSSKEQLDADGNSLQVADLVFLPGTLGKGAYGTVRLARRRRRRRATHDGDGDGVLSSQSGHHKMHESFSSVPSSLLGPPSSSTSSLSKKANQHSSRNHRLHESFPALGSNFFFTSPRNKQGSAATARSSAQPASSSSANATPTTATTTTTTAGRRPRTRKSRSLSPSPSPERNSSASSLLSPTTMPPTSQPPALATIASGRARDDDDMNDDNSYDDESDNDESNRMEEEDDDENERDHDPSSSSPSSSYPLVFSPEPAAPTKPRWRGAGAGGGIPLPRSALDVDSDHGDSTTSSHGDEHDDDFMKLTKEESTIYGKKSGPGLGMLGSSSAHQPRQELQNQRQQRQNRFQQLRAMSFDNHHQERGSALGEWGRSDNDDDDNDYESDDGTGGKASDKDLVAVKIFQKSILKRIRTMERNSQTRKVQIKTALEKVEREIAIMKKLSHPNLVCFYEAIDSPDSDLLYMVIEYMPLGEILTYQNDGTFRRTKNDLDGLVDGHFDEYHAALYFVDIMHGLAYLHQHKIVHRDLKPENVLIDKRGIAKLSDFGVSHMFDDNPSTTSTSSSSNTSNAGTSGITSPSFSSGSSSESLPSSGAAAVVSPTPTLTNQPTGNRSFSNLSSPAAATPSPGLTRHDTDSALAMKGMGRAGLMTKTEGTWAFWSPEMCSGGTFSGYAADLWAAGVCLYIFLCGQLPFYSDVPIDLLDQIKEGKVPYEGIDTSEQTLELLQMTLEPDPVKRAGVGDCLSHPALLLARAQRVQQLSVELAKSKSTRIEIGERDLQAAFRIVTTLPVALLKTATKQIQEGLQAAKHRLSSASTYSNPRSQMSSFSDRGSRTSSFGATGNNSFNGIISSHLHRKDSSSMDDSIRLGDGDPMSPSPSPAPETPIYAESPMRPSFSSSFSNLFHMHRPAFAASPLGPRVTESPPSTSSSTAHARHLSWRRRRDSDNSDRSGDHDPAASVPGGAPSSSSSLSHHKDPRVPFFFRKKLSDMSATSEEDEDRTTRTGTATYGAAGGASTTTIGGFLRRTGEDTGQRLRKGISALKQQQSNPQSLASGPMPPPPTPAPVPSSQMPTP